jgi:hypothetical protein
MCFFIENMLKNNYRPKPMVAKKDFKVWKIVGKYGRGNYYDLKINGRYSPWERGNW